MVAAAHAVLAVAAAAALRLELAPVMGVHVALKPLKFATSIAIFLFTMALFLSQARWPEAYARLVAILLAGTMLAETGVILVQAARGTTSHFNDATPLDAALWSVMVIAIVLTTLTMAAVAAAATTGPLGEASPLRTWAWRVGLWLFLLAAVSGFGMGGQGQHSVGGPDGGPGLSLTNWSTTHGDLRVPHFFALHVLQILPATAWLLERSPLPGFAQVTLLIVAMGAAGLVCVLTLKQAFEGHPLVRTTARVKHPSEHVRAPKKRAGLRPMSELK